MTYTESLHIKKRLVRNFFLDAKIINFNYILDICFGPMGLRIDRRSLINHLRRQRTLMCFNSNRRLR